ncbi:MAG: HEAT repeat domain-containing protein [Elusimicrobiota bacterium]|jgi:hypothetical protein
MGKGDKMKRGASENAWLLGSTLLFGLSMMSVASDIKPAGPRDKDYLLPASKDQELYDLWKTQSPLLRQLELQSICLRSSGRLAPRVASLLEVDPDEEMRVTAARVLGACGESTVALPALLKAKTDRSDNVRLIAANSLMKRKDPQSALAIYLDLLDSPTLAPAASRHLYEFKSEPSLYTQFRDRLLKIKRNKSASLSLRLAASMGIAGADIASFDDLAADLLKAGLEAVVMKDDEASVKTALKHLDWVEAMERNLKPDSATRGRMARAIEIASTAASEKVRNKVGDVQGKLRK